MLALGAKCWESHNQFLCHIQKKRVYTRLSLREVLSHIPETALDSRAVFTELRSPHASLYLQKWLSPQMPRFGPETLVLLISGYFMPLETCSTQRRLSPVTLPIFQTIFLSVSNRAILTSEYFSQCRLISWHKVFRAKMLGYCLDFPSLTL